MKNTARNLITALCCTSMIAAIGCSNTGELSVTGMYGAQGHALSGDECDELLMHAADADSAEDQEAAKEEYRECVENTLQDNGQHGECRDEDDATCDIILDEIGDVVERLRNENGQDAAPDCANAGSAGDEALCHLIAAYEACELDRNNDGDPDVGQCGADDPNCAPRPDECDQNGQCEPRPDECDAAGNQCEPPDGTDPNRPGIDDKTCEEIREKAGNVGPDDREFLERERPDCFNGDAPDSNTNPDGSEPGGENGENPDGESTEPGTNGGEADAFCAQLLEDIQTADTDQRAAELHEVYERECVN